MTTVFNDPAEFAQDVVSGFVRLHPHLVESVYGGVVRSTETPEGKVAVVIGGGSGHYPAFAGWVGPGMADGAVVGNVFASPSTQQIYSVAKAADRGAGVFFSYGNYAGDVLNFDLAQERLRAEGIPAQTVAVTDDVTSADATERGRRRGTAGDLVVFKVAGAAAEAGYDLDGVTRVAARVNERTTSFAVAFGGCTLPGATEPLFEVPAGQMGVGMGVHGEPGISEQDVVSSRELAAMLVERLLAERPADAGPRVAALVNGLGGTKYEELFVLWNDVAPLLEDAGLELVAPEVGELITSLDMAGLSLTLTWLDEELEELWTAPTETPGFRRGSVVASRPRARRAAADAATSAVAEASPESRRAAATLLSAAQQVADALREHEDELGRLDAIAGDGDHGRGMTAGATAALAALRTAVGADAGIATALAAAGDAWADRAGGTSGALWGTGLRAAAGVLDDATAPDDATRVRAVRAALDHVLSFGKAQRGDKTLLDALVPFTESLEEAVTAGTTFDAAWAGAAKVATEEADATADLTPRIGRARPLAERSVGHPDPGAVSLALVVRTAAV
ncbi:dihydroxyacetone kinase family protein [Cellulosimicrobium sp. CUA-896]|uniref:dihydroxyacetone kinase family protein n=1 Tax=Cellulosimicrobium sp. CUA-896 TaxID=1517881 RepID=UPI00095C76C6|nr:dihydroxyacetone kinase family protein [Cellulosimicrobium sp. CUA-896]OLT45968.1 D-erythrulose kinase [Cellulosimicrobium sp. CUA-896]